MNPKRFGFAAQLTVTLPARGTAQVTFTPSPAPDLHRHVRSVDQALTAEHRVECAT